MTGATYIYLGGCAVFVVWALIMALLMVNKARANQQLIRDNHKLRAELSEVKWQLEDLQLLNTVDSEQSQSRRKTTATNTDYLIEEEEYV